ncbi:hypothetical protein DFJ58DRAFT_751938 [Suillus subalutaceus]|uniref:uncharacterized protein n=1 Tax=Suillus subalutaceus TaxID=48586 RepID=UPI001B8668D4|nr:uncharacterized protein DFJ58DRAFT_751938 [Suillus subalutaceus]KAG1877601.1 hypothetical protein DFJ58DRAFT_751938 [Suillus subalutaceus]
MSNGRPRNTRKARSASLHLPRRCDPTPVPPSLTNSPHLSSPYSVFRRKPAILKTPSQEDDEWLRDMVPMDKEQGSFDENHRSHHHRLQGARSRAVRDLSCIAHGHLPQHNRQHCYQPSDLTDGQGETPGGG